MNPVRCTTDAIRETAIVTALAKRAAAVDPVAPGRWAVTLSNGADLAAHARVEDGWLLLEASLGDAPVARNRAWELLHANAALDGGARFALRARRPGLLACAEVALDDDVDLPRRVLDACAGLQAAHERLVYGPDGGGAAPAAAAGGEPIPELTALCLESGWGCVERDGGRLAVDLDVPGEFQQAIVAPRGAGVAVATPVLEAGDQAGAPPAPVCHRALGLLLLRVGGIVRLVRAAAEAGDAVPRARFEVVFGSRPAAAELAHAFAAVSVACRIAAREAAVLQSDAGIAQAYLAAWERTHKEDDDGNDDDDSGTAGE